MNTIKKNIIPLFCIFIFVMINTSGCLEILEDDRKYYPRNPDIFVTDNCEPKIVWESDDSQLLIKYIELYNNGDKKEE